MIDKAWPQTLVEIHGVVNRISLKNISDAYDVTVDNSGVVYSKRIVLFHKYGSMHII